MYGAGDPSIAGMILDSPFSDLVDLMMELVDTYKFRLPKFTVSKFIFWWDLFFLLQGLHIFGIKLSLLYIQVKFAIQFMRRAIQKKAKFDIMDLNTIKVVFCTCLSLLSTWLHKSDIYNSIIACHGHPASWESFNWTIYPV